MLVPHPYNLCSPGAMSLCNSFFGRSSLSRRCSRDGAHYGSSAACASGCKRFSYLAPSSDSAFRLRFSRAVVLCARDGVAGKP